MIGMIILVVVVMSACVYFFSCVMKFYKDGNIKGVIVIGCLTSLLIGLLFLFVFSMGQYSSERVLGAAICDENGNNLEFDKYEDGIVFCKEKPSYIKYDGLKIKITGVD